MVVMTSPIQMTMQQGTQIQPQQALSPDKQQQLVVHNNKALQQAQQQAQQVAAQQAQHQVFVNFLVNQYYYLITLAYES